MTTEYSSISQSGVDGYGNGSNGYGQGYQGMFGGDPGGPQAPIEYGSGSTAAPGGGGTATAPIQFGGPGMSPGQGIPGQRGMNRSTNTAAQSQGLKPMLSQLLGLSPQSSAMGQRRGLGSNRQGMGQGPRMQPPIMRGRPGQPVQGRPFSAGPGPMPRPIAPISGAPGGGTMRGGQGGPIQNPIQRGRVQQRPQPRQGQI